MQYWKSPAFVFWSLLLVSALGLLMLSPQDGWSWVTSSTLEVIFVVSTLALLMVLLLAMTEAQVDQVINHCTKHGWVREHSSAPEAILNPLPEHQNTSGFFSNYERGQGPFRDHKPGSRLIDYYIYSMRHQHLILALDEADLQNMTRSTADKLGQSSVRVLTAARQRNVLLVDRNNSAYHVLIAAKDFPEMLQGMMFVSITVSPALEGKAPDWVNLIKTTNEGKLAGTHCSYPHCYCPADHPGTKGWCLRGLPTGEL